MNFPEIYLIFFFISLVFSLLINRLFLKFSTSLGIRNSKELIIRWNDNSKPALGGISFFIIFLLSISFHSFFLNSDSEILNLKSAGLVLAVTMGFLIGLSDDAYNTRPVLKFIGQICCAVTLILTGNEIKLFSHELLNSWLTLFWVVGIMNSINMLDNMDGITTLVSLVILISMLLSIFLVSDYTNFYIFILVGGISSLIGFLWFNWHPSKMFMGDTGSQFLGVLLSALSVEFIWNNYSGSPSGFHITRQFLLTLLIFIIPITDTTIVVINRLLKGKSPFIGGRDHTTHHLFYNGITEKRIALLFTFISFMSLFLFIIIIKLIQDWSVFHFLLFGSYFILIFSILFYFTRKNGRKNS